MRASTDPNAVLKGALLPFGGHKGASIALMIELLVGPLIAERAGEPGEALHHAFARILGHRGALGDMEPALGIAQDEVGEGAADVDADRPGRARILSCR